MRSVGSNSLEDERHGVARHEELAALVEDDVGVVECESLQVLGYGSRKVERRRRPAAGIEGAPGVLVVTQRFDSALRLDPHLHVLAFDGVYSGFGIGESVTFHADESWTDADIAWLNRHVRALILGFLCRRGYLDEDHHLVADAIDAADPMLSCVAGAVQGTIAFGERPGGQVERFGTPREVAANHQVKKKLCADLRWSPA